MKWVLIVVFCANCQSKEMPFQFEDRSDMAAKEQCEAVAQQYISQGFLSWCEQKQ